MVDAGFFEGGFGILREGEFLVLPLAAGATPPPAWGEIVQRDFPSFETSGSTDYRDMLRWTPEDRARLPRSFDVVGDIVLVRLPSELEDRREEVGEALLAFVPSARLVGLDRGVQGPERRRAVERIAGKGPWSTRHRENGLAFDVDVARAYFSPRLAREHERVAAQVTEGDRVYDLCCGVGPFAVTIARDRRAKVVTAVDANPAAIELLRGTLRRCSFRDRVEPVESRLEEFLPRAEPRERVVLNLPLEGIKYLPSVARAVSPLGCLYYYEVVGRADAETRTEAIVSALGGSAAWRVADRHVVHPYSPASDLVAFVLARSGD